MPVEFNDSRLFFCLVRSALTCFVVSVFAAFVVGIASKTIMVNLDSFRFD